MRTSATPIARPWRRGVVAAHLLALVGVALVGCGEKRRFGDDDGIPVAFSVELERGFVADMRNNQGRVGVGAGAGFSSGGATTVGSGVGLSFSPTDVYLLGGEQSGGAQLFRKELSWGENAFTVPLRAGRSLTLTVQAQGGRVGWETIGTMVVPSATGANARITLLGSGPTIAITPLGTPASPPAGDANAGAQRGAGGANAGVDAGAPRNGAAAPAGAR